LPEAEVIGTLAWGRGYRLLIQDIQFENILLDANDAICFWSVKT
jgi:hypothetical protein